MVVAVEVSFVSPADVALLAPAGDCGFAFLAVGDERSHLLMIRFGDWE